MQYFHAKHSKYSALCFLLHIFTSLMFLKDYREEHPEVTVLDPPNAIQHLHNRQSMLQEVADLNLSNGYGIFFLVGNFNVSK